MSERLNPYATGWQLILDDPIRGIRRYRANISETHAVERTEYYRTEALFEANHADQVASDAKGWGEGAIVGRIPINLFYKELGEAARNGDDKYMNKWLNNPDHKKFRVKSGTV